MTIEKLASQWVTRLIEGDLVRVCAYCEREFGVEVLTPPGAHRSHGICKRHSLETAGTEEWMAPYREQIMSTPDEKFPPDLSQHPEIPTKERVQVKVQEGWKDVAFAGALGAAALLNPTVQKRLGIKSAPPPAQAQKAQSEPASDWDEVVKLSRSRENVTKGMGQFPTNVMKTKQFFGGK